MHLWKGGTITRDSIFFGMGASSPILEETFVPELTFPVNVFFSQISACPVLFYVNTIKTEKNASFGIDFIRLLAYNMSRTGLRMLQTLQPARRWGSC